MYSCCIVICTNLICNMHWFIKILNFFWKFFEIIGWGNTWGSRNSKEPGWWRNARETKSNAKRIPTSYSRRTGSQVAIHVESGSSSFKHPISGLASFLIFKFHIILYFFFSVAISLVQELNSEPVIPEGFPQWKDTMDSWGYKMISAIEVSHHWGSFCS